MISLTPGPTPIPDFITQVLQQPLLYHRSEKFKELYSETTDLLRKYFLASKEHRILCITGSGTNAMELLVANLPLSKKLLIPTFGKFSQRWAEIAAAYSFDYTILNYAWGDYPKVSDIIAALEKDPSIQVLCLTHSETSTATRIDVEQIAFYARKLRPDVLILVDGITSVGAMPFYTELWEIDAAITSSQKALGCPPGMSFVSISQRYIEHAQPCGYAYNLQKYLENDAKNLTPFTPATQILMAVYMSLKYLLNIGLPQVWNTTHTLAQYTRNEVQKLGLELCSKQPCDSLTAFYLPQNISASQIISAVYQETGILLGNGQGQWKNKIIRIAHMGYVQPQMIETAIQAIEKNILSLADR
ncbi:MAG: alanine--glyoxylate aminotransferase family protein [Bacteroidia bacterium]|nr:alanine--glyoxylate aminotransferase family protein [Bacteroidia bacterium]